MHAWQTTYRGGGGGGGGGVGQGQLLLSRHFLFT